jgi:integrase
MESTIVAKLTTTKVQALLRQPGKHGDGNGLWLHVRKPGQGAWHLHYGTRTRQRQMSLGSAEHVTLAEARQKADEARTLLARGIDPLDARHQQQAAAEVARARATSFAEAVDAYIGSHEAGWKNPAHRRQWRAQLDAASKIIGSKPVSAITTEDVLAVLVPLWTAKPETASRTRGRIEMVLSYAAVRGWRDRNTQNPALWRGHLQLVLPSKRKIHKTEHHAALPWQQAPAFMQQLQQREGFGVAALTFAIFTAVRSGEVRGATWAEIHMDSAVWTIPASRMKGGKEHRVPLSPPAIAILHDMAALKDGSGLVFLGMKAGVPLSDMTLSAVLRRMGRTETVHGFRSTFSDWAHEATHHSNYVIEQSLAHTIGNSVERAYKRGDLFSKRVTLMSEWAAFLARPAAEVVPLGKSEPARAASTPPARAARPRMAASSSPSPSPARRG